jgi:hypothetical protein
MKEWRVKMDDIKLVIIIGVISWRCFIFSLFRSTLDIIGSSYCKGKRFQPVRHALRRVIPSN